MKQQLINIEGIGLNYYTQGSGKHSIVFVHANSYNSHMWRKQFADERLSRYHLVAVDVPGHGGSTRLPDYNLLKIAALLPKFIEQVTDGDNIVVGLSMGSALLAEAAPDFKNCKGFFMASPNLFNAAFTPLHAIKQESPYIGLLGVSNPSDEDLHGFTDLLFDNNDIPEFEEYKKSYRNTDGKIREAILNTITTGNFTDMFANVYAHGVPVKYYFGQNDKAMHINYLDKDSKMKQEAHTADNSGHFVNIEAPEKFNAELLSFAERCFGE